MPTDTPYPRQATKTTSANSRFTYDALIFGAGPAGLSAAIYLARYNRTAVVVDAGEGRSTSHETNENYLGFPRGVLARRLRSLGCQQATRFGVRFVNGRVTSVGCNATGFRVGVGRRAFHTRTIVVATGVIDRFPSIANVERYVGRSLFWCITCDGWTSRGKRVMVVGNSDEAATTALQFLNFTSEIVLLTNADRTKISPKKRRALARADIPLLRSTVRRVIGSGGKMRAVETGAGERIPLDLMFTSLGSEPNIELARMLNLKLDAGYIKTDDEQRTSRKLVYAAGDVTKAFAHQIVTAAHEGATAGQAANYDLYAPGQRE